MREKGVFIVVSALRYYCINLCCLYNIVLSVAAECFWDYIFLYFYATETKCSISTCIFSF